MAELVDARRSTPNRYAKAMTETDGSSSKDKSREFECPISGLDRGGALGAGSNPASRYRGVPRGTRQATHYL